MLSQSITQQRYVKAVRFCNYLILYATLNSIRQHLLPGLHVQGVENIHMTPGAQTTLRPQLVDQ